MQHTLAIIGYGGMGQWHAENVAAKLPGITVKGIFDIRPEAQEKAAAKGLLVYATLQDLIADPEVDLVTIAVPNNFHKGYAIDCLRGGKNVICEKPVTMNAAELREIIAVSEETGKLFSVHQNRRWDKDYRMVRQMVAEKQLGELYFIERRVQGSGRMLHGWRGHAVNGGGMVYDWGVHLFDQLLWLMDSPVVSVTAHLAHEYYEEVDDNFKVFLQFACGCSALVEVSTNCFVPQPHWHLSGRDGTAIITDWDCNGEIVTICDNEELKWAEDIVYTAAGPTRTMAPRPSESMKHLPLPTVETDWADYYKNVAAAMDGEAELMVTPQQALRVMTLIDTIFEAGKTGQPQICHI